MARTRISTTVDEELLGEARRVSDTKNDAALLDLLLTLFLKEHRRAEIDKQYEAYDRIPLDTPDAWGDLKSFMEAAERSRRRG